MYNLLLVATLALGSVAPALAYDWTVERLADGVFAFLQPAERRFDDANSVVIVGDDGLLLVDAQENPEAVRALLAEIATRFDRPVRYLVNTHWHTDHVGGNGLVRAAFPDVTIVGHASLTTDVPGRGRETVQARLEQIDTVLPAAEEQLLTRVKRDGTQMTDEEVEAQRGAIERAKQWAATHREMEFLPPTLTYEHLIRIQIGARVIELHPHRGHTGGDTVLYLPQDRLLITGDLLDALPYVGHGHPREWVQALDTLAELDFDTIVPGHGPVFHGRAQLTTVRGFLGTLIDQVDAARAAGKTLEETTELIDVSEWRARMATDAASERFFDGVLGEAVGKIYE